MITGLKIPAIFILNNSFILILGELGVSTYIDWIGINTIQKNLTKK